MRERPVVTLVVPSEAYRVDDWMQAAARLGVEIAVATEAHHSLAEDMGPNMIPVDFDDAESSAMLIASSSLPIRAILAIDDRGVKMAARAARLRGLAHNGVETADATRDKAAMRQVLSGAVPQPLFVVLDAGQSHREALSVGTPAVVKPATLGGSVGVIRVDDPERLPDTIRRVRRIATARGADPRAPVLVERYVDGVEVAVEGMVTDGRWDTLAVFDKPDPLDGPYFAETHYVTPSRLANEMLSEVEATAARAASALGIVRGPAHAEFRVGDGVVLLEIASRPIGGLCGRSLRFGLADTPLEELLIRNALGVRVRGTRLAPGASGVSMIPVPSSGVFAGIDGTETARAVAHITDVEVSSIAGRPVAPLPEESTYLGFVFARAPHPQQVETALREACAALKVRIE